MPRRRPQAHGHKIRANVTVTPELYEWVHARVGAGREFASFSHAVERGLALLREGAAKR